MVGGHVRGLVGNVAGVNGTRATGGGGVHAVLCGPCEGRPECEQRFVEATAGLDPVAVAHAAGDPG